MYLAARGAKVVVNDLGVGSDGSGRMPARAEEVVREIRAAGGEAVADCHSVATRDGALAVVQTALDTWGQVDIVVNNAGVFKFALFDEISDEHIGLVLDTHLMGTIWMCRAVWPHMKKANYGRIVNTISSSFLGAKYVSIYGTAKGGILGLTRNLAIDGGEHGIKVNALSPGAATVAWKAMSAEEAQPDEHILAAQSPLSPDRVAPTMALLAHEQCPSNGLCINSFAGKVTELFVGRTVGVEQDTWTPESTLASWQQILDKEGFVDIGEPWDGCGEFTVTPAPYDPNA
jgi:NAD(P)-dependent dehydrogenase (short-subunit alcohol dehydrogenase family)